MAVRLGSGARSPGTRWPRGMRSPASPGARVGRSRTACGWSPGTGNSPTHTDRSSTPAGTSSWMSAGSPARCVPRSPRWPTGPSAGSSSPRARCMRTTRVPGPASTRRCCRPSRGTRPRRRPTARARSPARRPAGRPAATTCSSRGAGSSSGYGDRSDRFGYWPGRFALAQEDGGPVLVPERTDRPAQFLDVTDLAAWIVDAGLRGVTGAVDAYGPQRVLGDVLAAAREVAGFTGEEVPVSDEILQGATVEEYMGSALAAAVDRRPRVGGVQRPRHDLGPGRRAERPRADGVVAGRPGLGARAGPGAYGAKGRAGPRRRAGHHRGRPLIARSNYAVLTILGGFRTSETPTKRPFGDEPVYQPAACSLRIEGSE